MSDDTGSSDDATTSSTTTGSGLVCISDTSVDPSPWTVHHGVPGESLGVRWLGAATGPLVYTLRHEIPLDLGGGLLDPSGGRHLFIASHAPDGAFRWADHIGGVEYNLVNHMSAIDCAGNLVIGGHFHGEISVQDTKLLATPGEEWDDGMPFATVDWYMIKFSPDGQVLWADHYGDAASQRMYGLDVTGDGTIIVTGEVRQGTLELGGEPIVPGGNDTTILATFDPDGAFMWQRTFVGEGVDFLDIAVGGPDDAISVLAQGSAPIDLGGGPIPAGDSSYILAQFAADGSHRWSRRWQHTMHRPSKIAADASGGAILHGSKFGVDDSSFVLRHDATGEFAWSNIFAEDPNSADDFYVSHVHAETEIVVTGTLVGSVDFGGGILESPPPRTAMVVARYDLAGGHMTSKLFPATQDSYGDAAVLGQDGELVIAGKFTGSLDLGDGPVQEIGMTDHGDMFLHRLAQ